MISSIRKTLYIALYEADISVFEDLSQLNSHAETYDILDNNVKLYDTAGNFYNLNIRKGGMFTPDLPVIESVRQANEDESHYLIGNLIQYLKFLKSDQIDGELQDLAEELHSIQVKRKRA